MYISKTLIKRRVWETKKTHAFQMWDEFVSHLSKYISEAIKKYVEEQKKKEC